MDPKQTPCQETFLIGCMKSTEKNGWLQKTNAVPKTDTSHLRHPDEMKTISIKSGTGRSHHFLSPKHAQKIRAPTLNRICPIYFMGGVNTQQHSTNPRAIILREMRLLGHNTRMIAPMLRHNIKMMPKSCPDEPTRIPKVVVTNILKATKFVLATCKAFLINALSMRILGNFSTPLYSS